MSANLSEAAPDAAMIRELNEAVEAVREASRVCLRVRSTLLADHATAKQDRSPVTVADLGSQALISMALQGAFPGDPVAGEEDGSLLRDTGDSPIAKEVVRQVGAERPGADRAAIAAALDRCGHAGGPEGRFWTLDPVDGTKGFLRGGQYAIALALISEGRPVLAVLGCPNLGLILGAQEGGGAWLEPLDGGRRTQIRVRPPASRAAARWIESVEPSHSDQDDAELVRRRMGIETAPVRIDSQAKYAVVAKGDADIYVRLPVDPAYRERIWDHAAGWLLVTEAGGRVTDMDNRPLDFSRGRTLEGNRGVVATSGGELHAAVLEAIQR